MSNSGGQVRFIDPYGVVRNQSEVYGTAKDGQAWALVGSTWSWTTSPTPGSANNLNVALAITKKTAVSSASATAKKAATTKAAGKSAATKAKQSKEKTTKPASAKTVATNATVRPLHPAVLAIIAGFALLYGLYEYRQDLANKFYQFRTNRATRRANRPEAEGG